MQPSILIERLLFAIGVSLLTGSVIQYKASTAFDAAAEPVHRSRLSRLRPLDFKPEPQGRKPQDGEGIELLLGRRCLDGNPQFGGSVHLWNCTWTKYQQFNLTDDGHIDIDLGGSIGRRCLDVGNAGVGNLPGAGAGGGAAHTHRHTPGRQPAPDAGLDAATQLVLKAGAERESELAVLAPCNASSESQKWEFKSIMGTYKRFGELRNVGTGSCLARTLEAGNSTTELATLEPCVLRDGEHQEGGCEQSWYLPRYQQHYYLPDFQPHIPRDERRRLRKKRRASREAGRVGKLLCWVLTHPESHALKAAAVHRTWGSRCDYLLFVTSAADDTLPVLKVEINGLEDRSKIWLKTKTAWMHIYENFIDKADWFFKADDDTYAVVDNLRAYLATRNASEPRYFGRPFLLGGRPARPYYSGGSGFVLSRATLQRLGSMVNQTKGQLWAEPDKGPEDVNTADVLKKLGIPTEPSVDANGRQLFLPLGPHFEWNRKRYEYNFWFSRYSPEAQLGPDCCSERWVASHYVRYDDMYRMDNLERLQCSLHLGEWPHWGARSPHSAAEPFAS